MGDNGLDEEQAQILREIEDNAARHNLDVADIMMGAGAAGKAGLRAKLRKQREEAAPQITSELILDFLAHQLAGGGMQEPRLQRMLRHFFASDTTGATELRCHDFLDVARRALKRPPAAFRSFLVPMFRRCAAVSEHCRMEAAEEATRKGDHTTARRARRASMTKINMAFTTESDSSSDSSSDDEAGPGVGSGGSSGAKGLSKAQSFARKGQMVLQARSGDGSDPKGSATTPPDDGDETLRDGVGMDPASRREEERKEAKRKRKEAKRLAAGGSPLRPRGAQGGRHAGASLVGDRLDSGTLAGPGRRSDTRELTAPADSDPSGAPSLLQESSSRRGTRSGAGSGGPQQQAAQLDLVLVSFRRLALVLGYVELALENGDMLFPAVSSESKGKSKN